MPLFTTFCRTASGCLQPGFALLRCLVLVYLGKGAPLAALNERVLPCSCCQTTGLVWSRGPLALALQLPAFRSIKCARGMGASGGKGRLKLRSVWSINLVWNDSCWGQKQKKGCGSSWGRYGAVHLTWLCAGSGRVQRSSQFCSQLLRTWKPHPVQ